MRLPCLTYFSSRGRAELIRLLLADAGIEHDEIAVGPWSPTDLPTDFVALRATGKLAYAAYRASERRYPPQPFPA